MNAEPLPPPVSGNTLSFVKELRQPGLPESRSLSFDKFANPSLKDKARQKFLKSCCEVTVPLKLRDYRREMNWVAGHTLYFRNKSRLLINMAGGVMENAGISLDRLSGLPMIPGSAIKGCARRAALHGIRCLATKEERLNRLVEAALLFGWVSDDLREESDFAWSLGGESESTGGMLELKSALAAHFDGRCPESVQGRVAFLPAFPVKSPERGPDLELDIVNVHHKKYYAGEKDRATDDEEPIPVVFPAVAAEHCFAFPLVPLPNCEQRLIAHAQDWLREGLCIHGIGAKTAAGYGWFEEDSETGQRVANERKAAEEAELARQKRNMELAAMGPVERAMIKIRQAQEEDGNCRGNKINELPNEEEDYQRAFLRLFSAEKSWRDQLKNWRKKKPEKAKIAKELADKLGEELP